PQRHHHGTGRPHRGRNRTFHGCDHRHRGLRPHLIQWQGPRSPHHDCKEQSRWQSVQRPTRPRLRRSPDVNYEPAQAIALAKETSVAKYDATVEVALRLGVDPRKADQMVRGTVNLPHGTGKTARVLVFAAGDRAEAAREAGADYVGSDDLLEKVAGGFTDFDAAVATPDMMGKVGRLGKV